jgi:hypothetical protein
MSTKRRITLGKELLDVERCVTMPGIAEQLSLSYYAVQRILTDESFRSLSTPHTARAVFSRISQALRGTWWRFFKQDRVHGRDMAVLLRSRLQTPVFYQEAAWHKRIEFSEVPRRKCIYTSLICVGSCYNTRCRKCGILFKGIFV